MRLFFSRTMNTSGTSPLYLINWGSLSIRVIKPRNADAISPTRMELTNAVDRYTSNGVFSRAEIRSFLSWAY